MPNNKNLTSLKKKWSFWIDRGGTFTDIIAKSPDGKIHPLKLLSENPEHYEDAALNAIEQFLSRDENAINKNQANFIQSNSHLIDTVKIGTTVATNALLEHKGEPTLLLTSEGLADCLAIGTQARTDIFALNIIKPQMLYEATIPLIERTRADGSIETPLNIPHAEETLRHWYDNGLRSVAILLMHSYKFPANEQTVAALAKSIGYTQISASHQVSPLIKYIPRGDTTMIDAYLTPVLHRYTEKIAAKLNLESSQLKLSFMTSSGALTSKENFHGKDAILSGPAGGIVGAAKTAKAAGYDKIICFDMGGTSTDVAHYSGTYDLSYETEIAGHRLQSPMLHIKTVAAGGGSILEFKNNRMSVGPESAGANPGPASYRNGGPLTVTDANLFTGRINPAYFPHIFGKHANQPLDMEKVAALFQQRAKEINQSFADSSTHLTAEQCAEGYIRIANENMAAAIKKISVERGIDISNHTLQCFGGAGGQHAAEIAHTLGMREIYIHAQSSLLSAYGIGHASTSSRRRQMISQSVSQIEQSELEAIAEKLSQDAAEELNTEDETHHLQKTITCYLSYQTQETKLPVPLDDQETMLRNFELAHKSQFGFLQTSTPIIIQMIEVELSLSPIEQNSTADQSNQPTTQRNKADKTISDEITAETTPIFHAGEWQQARLLNHKNLQPNTQLAGPALFISPHQTIFTPKGWSISRCINNHITMHRAAKQPADQQIHTNKTTPPLTPDPIKLELFNNLFMSIAEQMGEALRATAQSVNIKERLDFSCAIFDAQGALIANAPHMPVHLGSMDRSVEAIIKSSNNNFRDGDSYMINAPYSGGTHLPDITVITPVFHKQKLIAFVASRGHHADIGGIAPGSMSPDATTIHEEGILIEAFKLVENHIFQQQQTEALLTDHPHPARNPAQNIADLKAQLAANAKGIAELHKIIDQQGASHFTAYMGFVQDQAEQAVKMLIDRLAAQQSKGTYKGSFTCKMDQGTTIAVQITPNPKSHTLTIDFTGTSPQTNDNFNAPEPVTRAAVLYVLRTLVADQIPMNAGCLRPVTIIIPKNSMLNPASPAAVVAGNVETSQVVTNCLYGALGGLGLSQGTMNNLTFGNQTHQYYETICSGAPAVPPYENEIEGISRPGSHGADAIHTHMTNSRLTDPEILETRYPVLLKSFQIDPQSGGKGQWCAGNGIHRSIKFLEPLNFSLLTGYRSQRIPGLEGGEPGRLGKNILSTATGEQHSLPGCCSQMAEKDDILTIITPTGGGYGPFQGNQT